MGRPQILRLDLGHTSSRNVFAWEYIIGCNDALYVRVPRLSAHGCRPRANQVEQQLWLSPCVIFRDLPLCSSRARSTNDPINVWLMNVTSYV